GGEVARGPRDGGRDARAPNRGGAPARRGVAGAGCARRAGEGAAGGRGGFVRDRPRGARARLAALARVARRSVGLARGRGAPCAGGARVGSDRAKRGGAVGGGP